MEIIVGKTAGFCYGVERAVQGAKNEVKDSNAKVYCLGEIVHNKQVVEDLEKRGIKFIEKPEEVKEIRSKTIIRAHGIPKETYDKCKEKNIEIVDYTCPKVLNIHEIADEYCKKGYYIVLVGAKNHPENVGTISYCGDKMSVIEKKEDTYKVVQDIKKSGKNKCLVIAQTTYHLEKFKEIEEILTEELLDNIELEIKNTICRATELRQKETEELSKKVDLMIIIGGKNSSNTKKLYEVASQFCKETVCIETVDELSNKGNIGNKKIGIMAGASTPRKSIEDVVDFYNSLI